MATSVRLSAETERRGCVTQSDGQSPCFVSFVGTVCDEEQLQLFASWFLILPVRGS